ncbi:MAG: UPF0175 family protein [Bacteroidota bacterium]|jgi:predicted HTH domain antitoxin
MKKLAVNIPDQLDLNDTDLAMIVSSHLYEVGKISLGQAAEVAGLSVSAFSELLSKNNISIFNYSSSELSNDVKNA